METLTMENSLHREPGVEWSVISRALPGESVSGDQHVVVSFPGGVLLAVIDGLGHGAEATFAAHKAMEVLIRHAAESVVALVHRCHGALQATRGAAMTLLSIDYRQRTATALGIGNVETMLVRADRHAHPPRQSVLLRNGVVGYQLPVLQASVLPVAPGDIVVFATDGVREDFGDRVTATQPLPQLVARILTQNFRGTDDALILACKLLSPDEE
jgi:serine phosphatase RsbU (regulator of sigma subunit)